LYVIITSCKRCGHRGISPASIVDDNDDDDDDVSMSWSTSTRVSGINDIDSV